MADTFRKVAPGERLTIPARTYNAFVDAARDFQGRQMGQEQGATPTGKNAGTVLVRNDSGADRERFDILGIDGPIFTPDDDEDAFKNQVALAGVVPTLNDHAGKFVILLEPLASSELGWAYISGACLVLLDVGDESHTFADVADNDCDVLKTAATGSAQILWKEEGTGQLWGVVRLGNQVEGIRWGVLAEDWDADTCPNYVTVNPCDRDGGNPDSETEVKVYLGWPDSTKIAPYFYTLKSDSIIPYLPLGQADDGTPEGTALRLWTTSVWGRVTADWQDGNNFVMVRLCDEDGAEIGYAADVKCWLFSPEGLSDIKGVKLSAGDLIRVELPTFDRGTGVTIAHAINAYSGGSTNKLLDGKNHTDTGESSPTAGALVCGRFSDPSEWQPRSCGELNSVFVVKFDPGDNLNYPTWVAPAAGVLANAAANGTDFLASAGNAGAILINDNTPEPAWLSKGTDGQVLAMDSTTGLPKWVDSAAGPHPLLGATVHSDTDTVNPTQGQMIYADAGSKWTALDPGAAGSILSLAGDENAMQPFWFGPAAEAGMPLISGTGGLEWYNGPTGTITFVTDLQSDGITWQKKSRQIDVAKGVVTRIGDETEWETYFTAC